MYLQFTSLLFQSWKITCSIALGRGKIEILILQVKKNFRIWKEVWCGLVKYDVTAFVWFTSFHCLLTKNSPKYPYSAGISICLSKEQYCSVVKWLSVAWLKSYLHCLAPFIMLVVTRRSEEASQMSLGVFYLLS